MPPTFDVYVWVRTDDRPAALRHFIDRYVDESVPGDPRFPAFVRTFIEQNQAPGDAEALAGLRLADSAGDGFSLYLPAAAHHGAIVTVTEHSDVVVLGLSIDDPFNSPHTLQEAAQLLTTLRSEFRAQAGIAGVELPPPGSEAEWRDDAMVHIRQGSI